MTPETITVTIPCPVDGYQSQKYTDVKFCYLAEALIRAGYEDVEVGGGGRTRIYGIVYEPQEEFDATICKEHFDKGESFTVTLTKLKYS